LTIWFSSLSLLAVLKENGIRVTGTVRADRLGKLKIDKKKIKREERGTMTPYYEKNGLFVLPGIIT